MAPGTVDTLRNREVVITGRLASMTREEAASAIVRAGGHFRAMPSRATRLLVAGSGGCPLGRDGRPTRALRRAQELRQEGIALEVIDEDAFLVRLGGEAAEQSNRLHTTSQLGRMLGLEPRQIREWVRAGLLRPVRTARQLSWFDFREVARARALLQLTRSGVSVNRIAKSLHQLSDWLPGAARSLTQLQTMARGELVVRLEDGRLADPTGQLRLDFDEHRAAPTARMDAAQRGDANAHIEAAMQAEARGQLEEAADAYHQALVAGGPDAELTFNLGNVLYSLDRASEALQRFMQAIELDSSYVEAWNNLGNAFAELGRLERALGAYQRALRLAPDYPDVHFNLAETYRQLGRSQEERLHWDAYLTRDPNSPWAAEARARLADLDARTTDGPGESGH